MMRVVLLTHVFPRAANDPLGAFLLHLIQGFGKRAGVFVVAPHAAGLAERETIEGIPVTRFHYAPDAQETLAYTGIMHEQVARGAGGKFLFGQFLLAYFRAALVAVRIHRPQVLHAHWWLPGGLAGALVSKLTHTPLVLTTHGTDVEQLRRARGARSLAHFTFSQARVITCGSNYLRAQLVELGVADEKRVRVIPMPVNPLFVAERRTTNDERQRTQERRQEAGGRRQRDDKGRTTDNERRITNNEQPITILTVARLTRQKSVETLVEALAILRGRGVEAQLRIAGDGAQRAELEQMVRAKGLDTFVTFLGMRPQAELPALYADCDVFVLPSVREGMGLVLAEALLCGAPVIATRSGGVTDIVRDGETGLLFPERDAIALADALEKYASDPALAARLAEQGRARVLERFTPERVAEQFLQVYEAVVDFEL